MRIEDQLWAKAQTQADRLGISMSAYISILISDYRVRGVSQVEEPQAKPRTPVRAPVPVTPTPASTPDPFDDIFEQIAAAREQREPAYDPTLDPDSRQYDQEKARSVAAPWDSIA
jgi:hypothetical protein